MKIVILGSTGSIGESTLEVVRRSTGKIQVIGATANRNEARLLAQKKEFNIPHTILGTDSDAEKLMIDLVTRPEVDAVVVAIVGFAALKPTLAAIRAGKRIALANKEALVTCGEILTAQAVSHNAEIIPVDSEHNSLFQALQGHNKSDVQKLWITGSGGPFRGKSLEDLKRVTVAEALKHPNWQMGKKITIDSATLMNKGLEFIEARWVFDLPPSQIDVIIHPQSVIHGLVEFTDGTQLAHLCAPDMQAAISYALYYPERQMGAVKPISLSEIKRLEFENMDNKTFRCFDLAKKALELGGVFPTVLNAANEVAVHAFLEEKIPFLAIPELIELVLSRAPHQRLDMATIFEIDHWARRVTNENMPSLSSNSSSRIESNPL